MKNNSINNKRKWYYPDLLKTIVFNKAPLNINNFISDWKTYSINFNKTNIIDLWKTYSINNNKNDIIDLWKNYSINFNKTNIIDIWKTIQKILIKLIL